MNKINRNEAVWFLILLGLSFYIFLLAVTGTLKNFIHPRMTPYIYFALFVLMVMAALQGTRLFEVGGARKMKKGYLLFLLPLICGMLLHPGSLNEEISRNKGVVISASQADLKYESGAYVEGSVRDGVITLSEDNFTKVLYSIWTNPEQYVGRSIAVEGFVYKDKSMESEQLIVSRMIINCCAADSVVVGVAAQYDGQQPIKENGWVSVVGTIRMMQCINPSTNHIETVPGINVERLNIIEKPENPYVYP